MRDEIGERRWDREEVVILVVEYFRLKNLSAEEVKKGHQWISFFLRKREEIRTGEKVSETFRNYAGIKLQSGRVNCLDPETSNSGMIGTKLQKEIVQEYLNNPQKLCDEADGIYLKYGRSIFEKPYMWCHKYAMVFQLAYEDKEIRTFLGSCGSHSEKREHKELLGLLGTCLKEAYDSKLVINEYREIIENLGIPENEVANPSDDQLKDFSLELILAFIAWHFRRDHFIENSWINDSVAYGHMYVLANAFMKKYENIFME